MDQVMLSLIPLALAAAFQPLDIIAMLVLLQTKRGTTYGLSFLAGMFIFRLSLGLGFWFLASSIEDSVEASGGKFSILVSGGLMILGLILLVSALRRIFRTSEEDHGTPSWLESFEDVSPLRVGLLGMAFLALDPKDWMTDLAAVNLIADADLSGSSSLLAYLFYLLLAMTFLLILLVLKVISPKQADRVLGKLNGWMKKHTRIIEIIMALLFGILFFLIGLERLSVI